MHPIIQVAPDVEMARQYLGKGYTPIECCFGLDSVVDSLCLDHHNDYWDLEPVSIRAYRDHYGLRATDARIVVTTSADLDATFAAASIAGLLPHSTHKWASSLRLYGRNLIRLAQMVARRDDEPLFALPLKRDLHGMMVATWEYRRKQAKSLTAFWQCVWLWHEVTTQLRDEDLMQGAKSYQRDQAERIKRAQAVKIDKMGDYVGLVSSPSWGFDQWLQQYPIIVSLVPDKARILIGARNKSEAQSLFGTKGLLEIQASLPGDWGGRASILTSPRNILFNLKDAKDISIIINNKIIDNNMNSTMTAGFLAAV